MQWSYSEYLDFPVDYLPALEWRLREERRVDRQRNRRR